MDDQQIIGLVGQGGIAGALIFVIFKVGLSMVAALKEMRSEFTATLKEIREEISDHTRVDVAAMAEVREDLSAIAVRIDTALDLTPIRGTKQRARTNPEGVSVGYYGPRKGPREDG